MTTKLKKSGKYKKFVNIIYILFYFFLVVGIVATSTLLFNKYYYITFYIDGQSMYPTLNSQGTETLPAKRKDFGIVDEHRSAVNKIKRFDIVTTYYPGDYDGNGELLENAEKKIKRAIGLPGETISTDGREIYINGTILKLLYTPGTGSLAYTAPTSLQDDEYFLIGDNWGHSSDSTNPENGPIKKEWITGVFIATEGTCILEINEEGKKVATDFKYHWPIFYKR